jgi:hypothetical protein
LRGSQNLLRSGLLRGTQVLRASHLPPKALPRSDLPSSDLPSEDLLPESRMLRGSQGLRSGLLRSSLQISMN